MIDRTALDEIIMNMKAEKYNSQHGICAGCNEHFVDGDTMELAHLVPQRKWILLKHGREVIHHRLNMKLTHSGECNAKVQLNPESLQAEALIEEIRDAILEEGR